MSNEIQSLVETSVTSHQRQQASKMDLRLKCLGSAVLAVLATSASHQIPETQTAAEAPTQIQNAVRKGAGDSSIPDHVQQVDEPHPLEQRSYKQLIATVEPAVVTIRIEGRDGGEAGIGTGFYVSPTLIATNHHVIGEGRPIVVNDSDGNSIEVLAVEASDVSADLAVLRVDRQVKGRIAPLRPAQPSSQQQGTRVLAFGNPFGLEKSVVEGIVSAEREIDGQTLLQLAMPIEPGNSGGPLVDLHGQVVGIVNMKSAIEDNLGFAIPIQRLTELVEHPNPIAMENWVKLGRLNQDAWQPVFGPVWKQRGGALVANGQGTSFGGRALLLSEKQPPEGTFEVAVNVRLNDESGAAGLAFHSDGEHLHYGFYPSGGKLRLTCFRGPSVFQWDILAEVDSEHYLPGEFNELKVRLDGDAIQCFVNGHRVIKSKDRKFIKGKVGLAKFRSTEATFTRFRIAETIQSAKFGEEAAMVLERLKLPKLPIDSVTEQQRTLLAQTPFLTKRELNRQAKQLEQQADRLRQFADDIETRTTIDELSKLDQTEPDQRLLRGALLIAKLDHPQLEVSAYRDRINEMADDIRAMFPDDADDAAKLRSLDQYLFEEFGYHGSRQEYYHPANSHLNRVIDEREGLPITLSVLYIELAWRLGVTVEGVGLPGHFIVRHQSESQTSYIDVFDRGKRLTDGQISQIVSLHTGRQPIDSDLQAATPRQILVRMLNNLIGSAGRKNDGESMLRYANAIVALEPENGRYQLLRAQLLGMTGRVSAAIEKVRQLNADEYPEIAPSALDRLKRSLESMLE
ncbi:trypsin-like peptidase domain-containing protein [Roseiconus lacunae]|nr:trypsin-like peptidase domain-containing protein [Roseiconus lacunae]